MGATSLLTTSIGVVPTPNTTAITSDNLLFIAIPIIATLIAIALSPLAFKRIHSKHGANVIEVSKITVVSIVSVIISALCILFFMSNAQIANAGSGSISINEHIDLVIDENSEVASAEAKITNGTGEIYSLDTIHVKSNNESISDNLWSIKIVEQDYDIYNGNTDSKNNISNVLQPNQSATIHISLQLSGDEENIFEGNIASLEIATKPTKMSVYYTKGTEIKSNNIDFNFDFAEYENADNTVVNRKLATVASLLTTKMYADEQIVVQGQAYDYTNKIALEKALGLEDNYYYSMWNKVEQSDPGVSIAKPDTSIEANDTTSYEFAHKKIYFGDHDTEIVTVNIAGTQCSNEWVSNLDFGADTKNYFDATGQHQLWDDKENHKGFDIAAKRVEKALDEYLNKYVQNDANTKKIIFITGHSRGAGVANIVGKDYEDMADAKTFTYTFAAPNTTDDVDSKYDYETIFNIMNLDDIVCQIPCTNMGYDKYGRDIQLSINAGTSVTGGSLTKSYSSIMKGEEYNGNDPSKIEEFIVLLKKNIIKGTREQCYEIDKDYRYWDFCIHGDAETIYTSEEADAEIIKIKQNLKENGLDKYSILEKKKIVGADGYQIIRWYNPAFILKDISNIILGEKVLPDDLYDYSDDVWDTIVGVIDLVSGLPDGHIPMSYVVLATNAVY